MKLFSLLLSLLMVFAFAQCDSSKKSSEDDSSSEETFQSPPEPEPAPAPGSAVVRGRIISIDSTTTEQPSVQIKLTEVEAYGAGTPQINTATILNVGISKSQIKQYKSLMGADTPIEAVLSSRQQQTLKGMGDSGLSWSLNSVKEAN